MRYIKTVSLLTMIMVGMSGVSYGAPMTSQIRRLMQEKEEKIKALEQCDDKRKGWMIAGISTIGLTAVGVGVNIAQTSKSNRLSGEIDSAKQELDKQEYTLQNINYEISEKERKKAELERQRKIDDCEKQSGMWWNSSTERCEPKLTSPTGSSINILPAPVLDNHPKLGDSCQDGAWIWTEVTEGPVPDDVAICIKGTAGTTSCVCAPKKLELMDALGAKSGGTLSKGDAKLAGLDTHKKSLVSPSYGAENYGDRCEYGEEKLDCICDAASGQVERFESPTGKTYCECPKDKPWNATKQKCESESTFQSPSYGAENYVGKCGYGKEKSGCVCDTASGQIERFESPTGKTYCECPKDKPWNATKQKCESKSTFQSPSYGAEQWSNSKKSDDKKQSGSNFQSPSYGVENYAGKCAYGKEKSGCVCDTASGQIERFESPTGKTYCECPKDKPWNATKQKCESESTFQSPSYGAEQWSKNVTDKGHLNQLAVTEIKVDDKNDRNKSDISDNRSAAWCFNHVRDYLLRECPKCISLSTGGSGFWDFEGENICSNIANNGGLSKIEWDETTKDATKFSMIARENGYYTQISCPSKCGKM